MDVTCERCRTAYEFDETLLSGRGTPVKCTNCGYVFKVYPRASPEADRTTSTWRLRLADGTIVAIDSIRELQRRIGQGNLTPDDEISRGDEGWKKLGSISELETFFKAAGFDIADRRIPSPLPPVNPPKTSKDSSLPPGRRPRQPTLLGVSPMQKPEAAPPAAPEIAPDPTPPASEPSAADPGPPVDAEPTPTFEPAVTQEPASVTEPEKPEPEPPQPGAPQDAAPEPELDAIEEPRAEPSSDPSPSRVSVPYRSPYRDSLADPVEDAEFSESPAASRSAGSVRTSTPPPAYYDDDEDIPELPGRGTSPLRWLLVVVTVGALALVVSQWSRVAGILGIGSDPALIAAGIAEGDAAVAEGHLEAYRAAIEAYGRAVEAGGDGDAELVAKWSNAYALAAQATMDSGITDKRVDELTVAATSQGSVAVALDGRNLDAKLAVVDALRLAGQHEQARERLEEVRAESFSRTAEFFRVDARLSAAEAGGHLDKGLRSARQAVELDPTGVRYLLLLARAEQAAGNDDRARQALETILADHAEHPAAAPLLATLSAEAPEDPEPAEAEPAAAPESAEEAPAEAEAKADAAPAPQPAAPPPKPKPKAAPKPAAEPPSASAPAKPEPKRPARRAPDYDEYDRLAKAAGSDAFVDGRPPVLDYESNMSKGRAELAAGNYTRARAYFDSALEVHPGSADAMDGLGDVATAVSDYASALRYYRVAAQRGHPDGYFKLGETYERLGKKDEAVSAYYTYVKRRPNAGRVTQARAAIKRLEPRAKLPSDDDENASPPTAAAEPAPEAAPEPDTPTDPEPEPAPAPETESP